MSPSINDWSLIHKEFLYKHSKFWYKSQKYYTYSSFSSIKYSWQWLSISVNLLYQRGMDDSTKDSFVSLRMANVGNRNRFQPSFSRHNIVLALDLLGINHDSCLRKGVRECLMVGYLERRGYVNCHVVLTVVRNFQNDESTGEYFVRTWRICVRRNNLFVLIITNGVY